MWKEQLSKLNLQYLFIGIAAFILGFISSRIFSISSVVSLVFLVVVMLILFASMGFFYARRMKQQHRDYLESFQQKEAQWNNRYNKMQAAYDKQKILFQEKLSRQSITEKSLKQMYAQMQVILDHIPAIVMIKDLEGNYRFVNQQFERAFHVERKQVLGKTDYDFFERPYAERMVRHDQQVIDMGGTNEFEERMPQRDGEHVYRMIKCVLEDASGVMDAVVCIGADVTDRRKTEDRLRLSNDAFARNQIALAKMLMELRQSHGQLQQAQLQLVEAEKRESIGRLAAGVAHEVKNPLAIMLTAVECLSDYLQDKDERVTQFLDDIQFGVSRADRVVRGLLDFSVIREFDLTPENSQEVIDHALNLAKHELVKLHVKLNHDLEADLPKAYMDRHKVEQVLLNLMMNAAHAMKSTGGELTVKTYMTRMAQEDRPEVPAVAIQIDDTGPGIPEDQIDKIFEPFFTTKPSGEGTGLGLSVCRSIIQLHGGDIRILNRREGGVRAIVMLRAEGGF